MTSHPEFGSNTTSTEAARTFGEEIRGKTILITGVSPNSVGAGLAASLAAHAPGLLVLASRTGPKITAVAQQIRASFPEVKIGEVQVDFSNLKSVRRAARDVKEILSREGRGIDVFFNNAGINISERVLTEEGVELQFATNHLGPFLFTNLLLPDVLSGFGRKRIVNTTSEAHRISPVRFSDINQEPGKEVDVHEEPRRGMPEGILRADGGYEPSIAYGQSKTANILFAVALNERLRGKVDSFAVMPGTIATNLSRDFDEKSLKALAEATQQWKTLNQGAATLVVAGFDPELDSAQVVYLEDCQPRRPSKWASSVEKADRLWKLSEGLVEETFNIGEKSRL